MERLVKLRWLTLENNRLFALPETLSALKNLIHLNLKSNHLKAIPVCLRYMKKLRYVFLNCNRIQDVSPDVLKYLTFIRMLNICDNPFCDVDSVRLQLKVKIYTRNITLTSHTKCCPQEHSNILCDNDPQQIHASNEDVIDDNEFDQDDDDFSDWENSIETSDIDSTDDSSSPENDIEVNNF